MNSRNPQTQLEAQGEAIVRNCDWCGKFTSKPVAEHEVVYGGTLYFCSQGCEDAHDHEGQEWGEDMGDLEDQYGTRGNTL